MLISLLQYNYYSDDHNLHLTEACLQNVITMSDGYFHFSNFYKIIFRMDLVVLIVFVVCQNTSKKTHHVKNKHTVAS